MRSGRNAEMEMAMLVAITEEFDRYPAAEALALDRDRVRRLADAAGLSVRQADQAVARLKAAGFLAGVPRSDAAWSDQNFFHGLLGR